MFNSKLYAGSETLTSDARIVKSTEENDVVLPKSHSRYGLFKKGGLKNEGKGNRTGVLSAPTGELWSQSDPMSVL
jgi:hypothetical protein